MSQKFLKECTVKGFHGKISFVLFPEVEMAIQHISQEQLHCMLLPEEQFVILKWPNLWRQLKREHSAFSSYVPQDIKIDCRKENSL